MAVAGERLVKWHKGSRGWIMQSLVGKQKSFKKDVFIGFPFLNDCSGLWKENEMD